MNRSTRNKTLLAAILAALSLQAAAGELCFEQIGPEISHIRLEVQPWGRYYLGVGEAVTPSGIITPVLASGLLDRDTYRVNGYAVLADPDHLQLSAMTLLDSTGSGEAHVGANAVDGHIGARRESVEAIDCEEFGKF